MTRVPVAVVAMCGGLPKTIKEDSFLLLDIPAQHLTEAGSLNPDQYSPLLIQCLNEDLVTLVLTCPSEEHIASCGSQAVAMELYAKVQKLGVAALVHAHDAMRHTAPAILNHHAMIVMLLRRRGRHR